VDAFGISMNGNTVIIKSVLSAFIYFFKIILHFKWRRQKFVVIPFAKLTLCFRSCCKFHCCEHLKILCCAKMIVVFTLRAQ